MVDFLVGLTNVDLTKADATPQFELGIPYAGNEGFFMYCKATETITAGSGVIIDDLNQIIPANSGDTAAQVRLGVAAGAMSTSLPYGWVWLGCGVFEAFVTNAVAAGTALTLTGTDGVFGTGADTIAGLVTVDLGVTSTRVTVRAATFMYTNPV